MHTLFGTGVAVVTPFTSAGEVDTPALSRIIEHLIAGGVEYLVALGTTAESATLSLEEQELVLRTFQETLNDRLPLVIGVGGNHTTSVCQRVEDVDKTYQPAAILSVSPYYNKPTQEGIYQHYRAVAGSTELPVILYNVPGRTASNITAETTLRLAHDCPNICAVKEASGNLEQAMKIMTQAPKGFALVSGDDALTLPLIALGAQGVISVTANALPKGFSDMVRAALAGDMARARTLHYHLLPAMQLNFVEGNPAGVKCLMALQSLCTEQVRLPLVPASATLKAEMQAYLTSPLIDAS